MSLDVLAAGEQLAADVAAEGAHARVDDQVPLERAPVLGDVVTVWALELVDGKVRGLAWRRGRTPTQTQAHTHTNTGREKAGQPLSTSFGCLFRSSFKVCRMSHSGSGTR